MSKIINKENLLVIILFCITSIVFLLIFSWSTSFLYDWWYGDSTIFCLLGFLTDEGMIPYKEFFDHKGPVIVFIEYLGYRLGDGKNGIFILQIIFLTFSLCGIYKIVRLFSNEVTSIVVTVCSLLILNIYFEGGNFTEEYCLPFLTWSTYFATKYLKEYEQRQIEHNPLYALFYGMTFMVCTFTRITNALPLLGMIVVGLGVLIYQRKYCNVLKNILFFAVGACIIALPVFIYFVKNDAVEEMIYATFLYNFKYVKNNQTELPIKEMIKQIVYLFPLFTSIILGIYNFMNTKKKRAMTISIILQSIMGIILQLSGMPYRHYLIIWVPMLVLVIAFLKKTVKAKRMMGNILKILVIVSFGIVLTKNLLIVYDVYRVYGDSSSKEFSEEVECILSMVSAEDKDYIIGYNVSPYFYISAGIKPCYKYCFYQDWHSSKDSEMYEEIKSNFESLKAKYIITSSQSSNVFDFIISENYHEVGRTESLVLLELDK